MAQPNAKYKLLALGTDIVGSSGKEFSVLVRAQSARWATVVKVAGICVE